MLRKLVHGGLYLYIFLLPLQTRFIFFTGELAGKAWEYGTYALYASDMLLGLVAVGAVIVHLQDFDDDFHFRNRKSLNIYFLIILLMIVGLIGGLFAGDTRLALYGWVLMLEGVLLFFVLMHTKFSLHRLAQVFVASICVQSLLALIQFLTQRIPASTLLGVSLKLPAFSGVSVVETLTSRFLRGYGTFDHPNILAAYVVVALVLALALIFTCRSLLERRLLYAGIAVLATGLFVTFSRSGYLALVVALFVIGMYLLVNKNVGLLARLLDFTLINLLVFVCFAGLNSDLIAQRFFAPEVVVSSSVTERVSQYGTAHEILNDHWARGVGLRNYTQIVVAEHPESVVNSVEPVHNVFLLVLAETGLAGMFVFILLFCDILRNILRFKVDYTKELLDELEKFQVADIYEEEYAFMTHWYIVSSGLVIAMLTWAFFDHFWWTLHPGIMLFWFIIGMWTRQFVRLRR